MPKSKSKRQPRRPPPKPKPKESPEWLGPLFFVLLGTATVIIIGNYAGIFGSTSNFRTFYGLGLFTAAFVLATQWR